MRLHSSGDRRSPTTTTAVVTAVLAAVLVAGLAGCGGQSPPGPATPATTVVDAALRPGQAVPAPASVTATVLTLTGLVGATNTGPALAFDRVTLDQLGLAKVSLFEPWTKKTMQFQGVWLADLLKVAQIDASARTLQLSALDDYQVELTMAEVNAGGILLATGTGDGSPIPVEDGGPTRIVFVDGTASGKSADQWIWSLKAIDVR